MMFHVFPAGRMCSLRRALLLWLVPVFLLVGAASAGFAYWSYLRMASTFMDNQMELLAESMGAQEQVVALPALTRERVHKLGSYVVQVFDADGKPRFSSWPESAMALLETPGFQDVRMGGERWRVYTTGPGKAEASRRIQVLQSGEFRRHVAVGQAGAAIAPVILLLPLSMLILWCVVAMVSREVGTIARQASAQDEHSIAELPLDRVPREIAPLVISFNSLLTRLRDAFATQRRFVQDAAHELRTPITAVGLQLENLRGDLCTGEPAQRFAQLEAGIQRAQRLVDQLLKLSRQESAAGEAASGPVNVHEVLHESINQLITLADQRNIDLGLDASRLPAEVAMLHCPGSDLRSVVDNLIENALRYAPEGSMVDVRIGSAQGRLLIEVEDAGPGIPPELQGRVFDRFFRVPGSDAGGSGLGLAIAQAAAKRCGLRITLRNRDGRSGLVARVETL
ncbi:MAG: ATP-binding protein [Polaromonas sp.]|uniref:sensor histidine kinase n=2 Tax=Polaromonas sp. TaxID=1869339 RepID=UPI0027211AB2|nr:ATP-binding protein [Polaromonas sp.]MDO9115564.1 ATP-binding protein [Polaromonas sp.]